LPTLTFLAWIVLAGLNKRSPASSVTGRFPDLMLARALEELDDLGAPGGPGFHGAASMRRRPIADLAPVRMFGHKLACAPHS
jgi:hypothetical protein